MMKDDNKNLLYVLFVKFDYIDANCFIVFFYQKIINFENYFIFNKFNGSEFITNKIERVFEGNNYFYHSND